MISFYFKKTISKPMFLLILYFFKIYRYFLYGRILDAQRGSLSHVIHENPDLYTAGTTPLALQTAV